MTFLYAHCPDVCPLIAGNLHTTLAELGPQAGHVQLIAVSVDPHGDTAGAVAMFLKEHELTGQMQYLIGSPERLSRTWKAWNVGSNEEVNTPGGRSLGAGLRHLGVRQAHDDLQPRLQAVADHPRRADSGVRVIPRPEHIQSVPAAALFVAMLGLALLVASCGGSGESSSGTSVQEGEPTSSVPNYYGVADIPPKPAPPLALQDSLGHSVNLNQFRGKAVLVTFIYDHCPDVCPIIVGNLHAALSNWGRRPRSSRSSRCRSILAVIPQGLRAPSCGSIG